MKGKKFLAFSLTVAMLAGSALTVSAAGVSDVFSAGYYADKYGDLKTAYGTDEAALLNHFITSGAKEGRVMSPILDVVAYRNAYADLNAAFGDNWDAYVDHYLTYGIKEKRTTGVLFDLADYAAKNADVKAAYGDNYAEIAKHYVNFGIKEGRPGGAIVKAAPAAPVTGGSNNGGGTTTTPEPEKPTTTVPAEHVHIKGELLGAVIPTCKTPGYNEWRCDAVLLENKYDAKGNWIGTGPVLTPDGQEMHCDRVWRENLSAAHIKPVNENQVYVEHATCASNGKIVYTCTLCGEQQTEVIEKLQPVYNNKVKSVASKSCKLEDRGYDEYQCVNCKGSVHANNKVMRDPLPHRLSNDKDQVNVITPSTCTAKGSAYGYCSICAAKVTVDLDFAPHKEKTVPAFADAYLLGNAARSHVDYTVTYCENCKEITAVVTGVETNCADADGDGACDVCKLLIDRNATGQIKDYKVGETFIGNVQ